MNAKMRELTSECLDAADSELRRAWLLMDRDVPDNIADDMQAIRRRLEDLIARWDAYCVGKVDSP